MGSIEMSGDGWVDRWSSDFREENLAGIAMAHDGEWLVMAEAA